MPASFIAFWAEGAGGMSPDFCAAGAADCVVVAPLSALSVSAAAPAAPASILAITAPTPMVSPSATSKLLMTPATGDGTSTLTLSVSSSTIASSAATLSPTFFMNWPTVASVTNSPSAGTVTSCVPPPGLCRCVGLGRVGLRLGLGLCLWRRRPSCVLPLAAPAPSPIWPSSAPTSTVSPALAVISIILPAAGAGTSTDTLSVSSSSSGSSAETLSPSLLYHCATVASVTDSPRVGTRISVLMGYVIGCLLRSGCECGRKHRRPAQEQGAHPRAPLCPCPVVMASHCDHEDCASLH